MLKVVYWFSMVFKLEWGWNKGPKVKVSRKEDEEERILKRSYFNDKLCADDILKHDWSFLATVLPGHGPLTKFSPSHSTKTGDVCPSLAFYGYWASIEEGVEWLFFLFSFSLFMLLGKAKDQWSSWLEKCTFNFQGQISFLHWEKLGRHLSVDHAQYSSVFPIKHPGT